MLYHAIINVTNNTGTVRPMTEGVIDFEFEHGCRILTTDLTGEYLLGRKLVYLGYECLDKDNWNDFLGSLDDPSGLDNDRFVATRIPPCHKSKE